MVGRWLLNLNVLFLSYDKNLFGENMRYVMTDNEVSLVFDLENFVDQKASQLCAPFFESAPEVIDAIRILVCEYAFRAYVPFAKRFNAGNSAVLRNLLDKLWECIDKGMSFPDAESIQSRLNEAGFDYDDWSHESASDAVAAICIFETCLSFSESSSDRFAALNAGASLLFRAEVHHTISNCAVANGELATLAESVKSGAVMIAIEQELMAALSNTKEFMKTPNLFVKLIRELIQEQH